MNYIWQKKQRNLTTIRWNYWKGYFKRFADMKDPIGEESDHTEAHNTMEENNNEPLEDNEHGLYGIVD